MGMTQTEHDKIVKLMKHGALQGIDTGRLDGKCEDVIPVEDAIAIIDSDYNKSEIEVMLSVLDRSMECVLESDHRSFSNRETENGWLFDHIIEWRKMIKPYIIKEIEE